MLRWAQAPFPLTWHRVRVAVAVPAREGSIFQGQKSILLKYYSVSVLFS